MKRYLLDFNLKDIETECYDVVIVGSGLAGLYTALNIDKSLSIALISKASKKQSNSYLAQGGIAAVLDDDDKIELHFKDTLNAGADLCESEAVNLLVTQGPTEIYELMKLGVEFDSTNSGVLHTTREGGHSKSRILHCGGDATGKEIVNKLSGIIESRENIRVKYETFLVDIITYENKTLGVLVYENGYKFYKSSNVVICSGGIGHIYKYSTNPNTATGDGIAAAIRAGAIVKNMEFIQFHPTALYNQSDNQSFFLISEAVRGEGGILVNNKNERFMKNRHEMKELAPRDIVAREIFMEIKKSGIPYVYLDITSKSEEFLKNRFPTIYKECLKYGINISKDKIPVCPVQHYFMGGIKTDLFGESSVCGLYACGEVSYTGVHGANRLASNSLLECVVFGKRCAEHINNKGVLKPFNFINIKNENINSKKQDLCYDEYKDIIKFVMDEYGGIVRNEKGLLKGINQIESILNELNNVSFSDCSQMEVYNMALVANEILNAALKRKKSIGAHFRNDEEWKIW